MLFSYSFKSVLDFVTASELLKLQLINKYVYNSLMPTYFSTSKERKNILSKLKIPEKICRKAILLFHGQSRIHINQYIKNEHESDESKNLKW